MAERTLPGLGLTGFWDVGSDYKAGMDANLRKLSVLVQPVVKSRTTILPGAGAVGDIYIVPAAAGSNANQIAIWDGESGSEAWVYLVPNEGWAVHVLDTQTRVTFDGSNWVAVQGSGGSFVTVSAENADFALSDAMLAGGVYKEVNSTSGSVTVTVPTGLSGREPVVFEQIGGFDVQFVAASGVVIHSYENALRLAGQYASASLVPKGSDTYSLVGNLKQ